MSRIVGKGPGETSGAHTFTGTTSCGLLVLSQEDLLVLIHSTRVVTGVPVLVRCISVTVLAQQDFILLFVRVHVCLPIYSIYI